MYLSGAFFVVRILFRLLVSVSAPAQCVGAHSPLVLLLALPTQPGAESSFCPRIRLN
jgi:hypothetical protein